MSLTIPEIVGLITVIGALITAFVSYGKLTTDNKSAIVTHFKTLVDVYLAEIKRLNEELEDKDKQHQEQVKNLKDEITTLIVNHKQDLATLAAEHIQELARIKATHQEEISGIRRALEELKDFSLKQAQDLAALDRRRNSTNAV